MSANYAIAVDPARSIVRMHLDGFFEADDVAAFVVAMRDAYNRLGARLGEHLTLVDVAECKIQKQDVVEAFRTILSDPAMQSRRIAFVTGGSPARMQIRRLISRDSARAFADPVSAEQWLLAKPAVRPDAIAC